MKIVCDTYIGQIMQLTSGKQQTEDSSVTAREFAGYIILLSNDGDGGASLFHYFTTVYLLLG
jgi:hypothetical protein